MQDHQRELAAEQPAAEACLTAAVDRLQQAQPNHRGWSPSNPPGGYHKKPWHCKGGAKCTRCGRNRHVDIHIQDGTVPFKIDTGAEVTAITQETWHRLGEPPLAKPTTALYGPAHQTLDVLGQVTERLTRGQHSSVVRMFVVEGWPLIGSYHCTTIDQQNSNRGQRTQNGETIPWSLQGPRDNWGGVSHQAPGKDNPLLPICATQCPDTTATTSERGTQSHGTNGSHLKSQCAYTPVCGVGGSSKEVRGSEAMR